jgi:hypothetical protein
MHLHYASCLPIGTLYRETTAFFAFCMPQWTMVMVVSALLASSCSQLFSGVCRAGDPYFRELSENPALYKASNSGGLAR